MTGSRVVLVLRRAAAAAALLVTFGCDPMGLFGVSFEGNPRLTLDWSAVRSDSLAMGLTSLDPAVAGTTGRVYVPSSYAPGAPIGLLVMLHGGGSAGSQYIGTFQQLADSNHFIVLAPDSKQSTWDLLASGKVGVDVPRLGDAIEFVLRRATVDPARIWLGGHSDGASYALTVGTANGDHFTRLLIFSAGEYWTPQKTGRPPVRVAHGQFDPVFAFSGVDDEIVGPLQRAGYAVTFAPFSGGHELSQGVAADAIAWLTAGAEASAQQGADVHLGRR